MRDWVNDMLYSSWCKTALKRKIEESVKGHVCIGIINDDAIIQILSEDYSKQHYSHVLYDFAIRMENHELTELDLVNISGQVVNRFKSKIFSKYFK
jgi:hypothetical protein